MRILLIGCNGQLGWELQRTLPYFGRLMAVDYPQIDITNPKSIELIFSDFKPEVVINSAAYTDVDRAESEIELCMNVNAQGPKLLAQACQKTNALLVHYSTDYVFSGKANQPYIESDETGPVNVYGESKALGEIEIQNVFDRFVILRTAWMYSLRSPSFLTKVLSWAAKNSEISVVDDQISNPTWARAMAEVTALMISKIQAESFSPSTMGIFHLAGNGFTSRFDWAKTIVELSETTNTSVIPAKSADFQTPAIRPSFSALNCEKFSRTFGIQFPNWRDCLKLAMKN